MHTQLFLDLRRLNARSAHRVGQKLVHLAKQPQYKDLWSWGPMSVALKRLERGNDLLEDAILNATLVQECFPQKEHRRQLNWNIERQVGGLYRYLYAYQCLPQESPEHQDSQLLLDSLFPNRMAFFQIPRGEQWHATKTLLQQAHQPTHRESLQRLQALPFVQAIQTTYQRYTTLLQTNKPQPLPSKQLFATRTIHEAWRSWEIRFEFVLLQLLAFCTFRAQDGHSWLEQLLAPYHKALQNHPPKHTPTHLLSFPNPPPLTTPIPKKNSPYDIPT